MTYVSVMAALTFFLMPAPTVLYGADLAPTVTLPAGYFVLQAEESAPPGYISVAYDDLRGYVLSSAVRAVDYRPVTKYETTVRFTADNDGQPVNLRAAPKKSANIISVINAGEGGRCYGDIDGEQMIPGAGNKWYYVAVGTVRGYCYGAHISVSPTPPNIIEKEPDEPAPAVTEPEELNDEFAPPQTSVIILIVALCLPVPFIMIYMFRKPRQL